MQKINAEKILTVGCAYLPPKGGIAQVLYNYDKYIYCNYRCLVNSKEGNKLCKISIILFSIIRMFFILLCSNVEIVHIHTASYNSFIRSSYFVRLAKKFHRKVVLHVHGGGFKDYYNTKPDFVTSILNQCDSIITLTQSWKDFFQKITTCRNIEIVNNIVSPPVFVDMEKDTTKKHLLFLGLITEQKGIYDLLDVIAKNKHIFENKMVLHIGGNGEVKRLTDIIENKGLQNIVIYEGWVSGDRKVELFNYVDAFVLPSYIEGLPVSILEAMSYGLTVITTPVGGIPEILTEKTGVFFKPGDKMMLADILCKYVNNEYDGLGKQAQVLASNYYPEAVEKQLIDVYNHLK